MEHRRISRAVITRLPRYYRFLGELLDAGVERIYPVFPGRRRRVRGHQRQEQGRHGRRARRHRKRTVRAAGPPSGPRHERRQDPGHALRHPNVGKSTFINTFAGSVRAKAADRPGVTKGKQWVSTEKFDLLDMPGVLWKKFDSKTIASNLAFIGSIKDDILDVEELAMNLLDEVRRNYPDLVASRYKLDAEALALPPYELMEAIGRKRGLLVRGGEVNTERCAIMLVDEFRACKWGRITLERPPRREDPELPEGEDEA